MEYVFALFWLFLVLAALQPAIHQHLTEAARQRKIQRVESKRETRVILLVHRQETMRLLGFPLMRYIDMNDSEAVLRAIHMTEPDMPIDLVLHTPGGLVLPSIQIARALRGHRGRVTVFVPHSAMSGGTLIALAADEIVMCRHAVLGPIDPQIGKYPAASVLKVVDRKPIEEIDDETLIMADIGRKAMRQLEETATRLLARSLPEAKAAEVAALLTQGNFTHDYPIGADEAVGIGLNVNTGIPDEILELMSLYPQPVRSRPSGVDYLPQPVPRRSGAQSPMSRL